MLADNKACVLIGHDADGRAQVLLPETGQGVVALTPAEFVARHVGVTLFVRPQFRFDSRAPAVRASGHGHWFWSANGAQRLARRQQFDIGQRSLLDLRNAENELYTAKRAYANAEADLLLAPARTLAATQRLVQSAPPLKP